MKFIKDLLFFEIQTTGQDPDKDSIIQLSAILLDKDNLLEKNNFNSYIRVSYLDSIINDHAKLLHTDYESLRKSPKVYDAIKSESINTDGKAKEKLSRLVREIDARRINNIKTIKGQV